jgi:hypothetical protein
MRAAVAKNAVAIALRAMLVTALAAPCADRACAQQNSSIAPNAEHVTARIAFAAASSSEATRALTWLRREILATRRDWPKGRNADDAFAIAWNGNDRRVLDPIALPSDCAAVGELLLDGCTIAIACNNDGSETWRIRPAKLPTSMARLLASLRVDIDGPARVIDFLALAGNLAGAAVEEDEFARRLHLAAVQCGEVTVSLARDGDSLVVKGKSNGGLIGPAYLLHEIQNRDAAQQIDSDADAWRARAFAGVDGDRVEAARQLQRIGEDAVPSLRALLHGDEASRLCAMDALVRLQAAAELPRILAAADADMALATAMAETAATELWPHASEATRQQARDVVARNAALDQSRWIASDASLRDARWRMVAIASVSLACWVGLWLRERARLTLATQRA